MVAASFDGGSGKMRRAEVTVEELLVDRAIKEECPWENLPRRLQVTVPSKEEWHKRLETENTFHLLIYELFLLDFHHAMLYFNFKAHVSIS